MLFIIDRLVTNVGGSRFRIAVHGRAAADSRGGFLGANFSHRKDHLRETKTRTLGYPRCLLMEHWLALLAALTFRTQDRVLLSPRIKLSIYSFASATGILGSSAIFVRTDGGANSRFPEANATSFSAV